MRVQCFLPPPPVCAASLPRSFILAASGLAPAPSALAATHAPPPLPSRHPTRVTRHTHARSLALYFVAITRQRHLFVSSTVALLDIFIKSTTHLIHICCRRLLFPLIDRSAAEQVVGDVGVCVLCFAYRRDGPSNAFVASNLQRGDEHFPGIVYRSALPIARSSFS